MEPEGPLPDSPTPSHSISLRYILILPSNLHLDLPTGLFPTGFLTKSLYACFPPAPY